jgi:hypothetical protein
MYKQGEGRGVKNSDLALPEWSVAKRRGVKVMMVKSEGRKEVAGAGQKGAAKATNPQSSWCISTEARTKNCC